MVKSHLSMQKLFLVGFVLISFVANAQFKVNVAGGYASPVDKVGETDFVKPGFVYSVEPQYELGKNLEVGVRLEQAFIQRAEYLDAALYYQTKAKSMLSAALTANYVVKMGSSLRPYVGAGVGIYYADKSEQTDRSSGNSLVYYPLPATTALGGVGRVGIKFKSLNVEANYNLIGDTSVTNGATRRTLTAKNSYFSVKAGLTIGGSR